MADIPDISLAVLAALNQEGTAGTQRGGAWVPALAWRTALTAPCGSARRSALPVAQPAPKQTNGLSGSPWAARARASAGRVPARSAWW